MKDFLAQLPEQPGVYQMKNASGKVIYVGKSVNLKSRVFSYFHDKSTLNGAKRQMVEQVRDIETILTRNGTEALILETNLIKELRPKYNVLMKDDKDLAYIRIIGGPVRGVEKTRLRGKTGKYFGPYPSGMRIASTLENLRRTFCVRSCRMTFEEDAAAENSIRIVSKAGRSVPCMDHYIGICPAPCLLKKENLDAHETNVARLERFLKGERGEVLEDLRREMSEYSKALRFEEAGKTKERLESLELLSERQVARNEVKEEVDALVTMEKNSRSYVAFCRVRQTEIRSFERHGTENPLAENAEVAGVRFLCDLYAASEDGGTSVKTEDFPKILLLAEPLQDTEFEEFLRERGIAVEYPKIGPKADLLRFLKGNLAEYALKDGMEKIAARSANRATMVSILEGMGFWTKPPKVTWNMDAGGVQTIHSSLQVLGPAGLRSRSDRMSEPLPQPKGPLTFECYDISHTDGHFTVASRVVVTNGKPDSAKYRKYKIKTLADGGIDDFESLREVLYRRTLEGFESNNFPTMLVIDGGKWQLSAAREGISRAVIEAVWKEIVPTHAETSGSSMNWESTSCQSQKSPETIPFSDRLPLLCSLAKREEEIFIENQNESIRFEKGSAELSLLQNLRDEAHRFAISFNRASRSKAMKKNVLEELPGFGPVTRKKLLSAAGSVEGIRELERETLEKILNSTQIETLENHALL